ncbi:MAG: hypothetical protein KJI71_01035 [Patescibacteria group bacterium]|nr:hypothetical protein [Patescibacteria group bacterium]
MVQSIEFDTIKEFLIHKDEEKRTIAVIKFKDGCAVEGGVRLPFSEASRVSQEELEALIKKYRNWEVVSPDVVESLFLNLAERRQELMRTREQCEKARIENESMGIYSIDFESIDLIEDQISLEEEMIELLENSGYELFVPTK